MQIFLRILKELGIAIIFILLIVAILAFAFRDKVPFGTEVPEAVKYTAIDREAYTAVSTGIEEQKNPDQIYQTSAKQLEQYLTEKIVSPGRIEPFDTIESVSDIPEELVKNRFNIDGGFTDDDGQVSINESTLE